MTKKDLINELVRLGIDASPTLNKTELERMLVLAKTANKDLKPHRVFRPQYKETRFKKLGLSSVTLAWILFAASLLVIFIGAIILFNTSATFRDNITYLGSKVGINFKSTTPDEVSSIAESTSPTTTGPQIFEKNNKTYVVYDYPLVRVDVLVDNSCKRDTCDSEPLIQQIKTSITPLIKTQYIDYKSREGKDIIDKYGISALPVFIFDEHLNRTENFAKVQHLFSLANKKYILQAEPYKILSGPNLATAHIKGAAAETAPVTIVEYSSFSCPHCKQSADIIRQLTEKYPDQLVYYFKHYDRGGNDTIAAYASECASAQGKFWEMHDKLFATQLDWVGETEARFKSQLTTYARQLKLDTAQFAQCLASDQFKDLINADTEEAKHLGVENLPTFLINQDIVTGIYPVEEFSKWIDAEIEKAK